MTDAQEEKQLGTNPTIQRIRKLRFAIRTRAALDRMGLGLAKTTAGKVGQPVHHQ